MDLVSMYMFMTEMIMIMCTGLLLGMGYLYFLLFRMIEAYNNYVEVKDEHEKIDVTQY